MKIIVIIFVTLGLAEAQDPCGAAIVQPCKCEDKQTGNGTWATVVECRELGRPGELSIAAKGIGHVHLMTFSLFSSDVGHLPVKLFAGSVVRRIQIYDTPIEYFNEGSETAFTGLEYYLEQLTMRRCDLNQNHSYSMLESISSLTMLDLSYNLITEVPLAWFKIPPRKLAEVYLKGNQIGHIEEGAFAALEYLRVLDLSENRIDVIDTNILPNPATNLEFLYLSYNEIKELPRSFFNGMTILDRFYLDHNRLTAVPIAFQELWTIRTTLSHVDLLGNNITCDVSMCWLAFYENSFLTGSCADPDKLRGRRFRSLWPWELDCNNTLYKGDTHLPYRAKL